MASPGIPSRLADLNKLSTKNDGKIITQLLTEVLFSLNAIATKLDAEGTLTQRPYLPAVSLKK